MMKSVVRNFISVDNRRSIRRLINILQAKGITVASKNKVFTSIYYSIVNGSFKNEQRAVLSGRVEFNRNKNTVNESSPQLRRNIHRLEKGLIMKTRRDIFGEAFILETVELFASAYDSPNWCREEKQWAEDILSMYFKTVGSSEVIDFARNKYSAIDKAIDSENAYVPYQRANIANKSSISVDDLRTLFEQRRSVRWYSEEAVPEQLINQAIELAKTAPSACNRQPFEFLVINDPKIAPEVTSIAAGTSGFSHQVPCLILAVGDLSCYPTEADKNVIYIDASLASMQLMLAFETIGLSSCPINWPVNEANEIKLRSKIALPKHKRVVMMISVGYADPTSFIAYSSKKSLSVMKTTLENYK
ncbi:nitroreductase family protein [Vibrio sp. YYF0003]|uniref:nitroreductase family protein n=1 Tax=Vibrio sp. YYF0003 TaxID=3116646 RepID=UPI002EC79E7B|nr:nitroreductase family protein [Vibrio sp. YYF0003]